MHSHSPVIPKVLSCRVYFFSTSIYFTDGQPDKCIPKFTTRKHSEEVRFTRNLLGNEYTTLE